MDRREGGRMNNENIDTGAREQFEAWAMANELETKLYAANGMYSHPVTRGAWIAWQARAAQPAPGIDGYQGAFYELAGMLNISAQPRSPKEVWETQMRPLLQALVDLAEACEWHEIDEHGYEPAAAVSRALARVIGAKA